MKRLLTATIVASGLLFAGAAAPAFADPGYGRGDGVHRDGGHRDGGYRDGGSRHVEDAGHRRGHWGYRHWRHRNCFWDRVCFRNRWGEKRCHMERVCRGSRW